MSRDTRICRYCEGEYTPRAPMQPYCSPFCSNMAARARKAAKAQDRGRPRQARARIPAAQESFNAFIRARDLGKRCISCDRPLGADLEAGHYLSVGSHPELRFNEDNAHGQCHECNQHRGGNPKMYRFYLVRRIGLQRVEALEAPMEAKHYTAADLRLIAKHYEQRRIEIEEAA